MLGTVCSKYITHVILLSYSRQEKCISTPFGERESGKDNEGNFHFLKVTQSRSNPIEFLVTKGNKNGNLLHSTHQHELTLTEPLPFVLSIHLFLQIHSLLGLGLGNG